MTQLKAIRIVLVNPSHPGNIGATARAMKTMGLSELVVVNPQCSIDGKAKAMASGAEDLLTHCHIVDDLKTAVTDCELIFATSTRTRKLVWPLLTPKECAQKLKDKPTSGSIAIVFGRERSGLTNEELQLSHYHIWIPGNPDYSSLNLAAAVQVIAYELFQTLGQFQLPKRRESHIPLATQQEMDYFYEHLERVLTEIDFLDRNNPRLLMQRLIRLFNRAHLDHNEVNILRGILTAIQRKLQ